MFQTGTTIVNTWPDWPWKLHSTCILTTQGNFCEATVEKSQFQWMRCSYMERTYVSNFKLLPGSQVTTIACWNSVFFNKLPCKNGGKNGRILLKMWKTDVESKVRYTCKKFRDSICAPSGPCNYSSKDIFVVLQQTSMQRWRKKQADPFENVKNGCRIKK